MRIAIIGTGISGLTVARLLCGEHDISVFETRDRVGGHTHTVQEKSGDRLVAVDTGFIVFNERTYPHFMSLLRKIGVPWQNSNMSFSVLCEKTGVEYCPSSLDQLFAQRSNILRPRFWSMLKDLIRFRKAMPAMKNIDPHVSLGQYLEEQHYSSWFRDLFIIPMGAAIWSADPQGFEAFPACMFARFFDNHGFLEVKQPQWLTVKGGSQAYLKPLVAPFQDRIHTQNAVQKIQRDKDGVVVHINDKTAHVFDEVVLALHSDQALKLLADPTEAERDILGDIAYQPNDVVLHTDTRVLPQRRKAWASWNYHVPRTDQNSVSVTYNMNMLQSLETADTFCVTLNGTERIDPAKIRRRFRYSHPVFTPAALAAQGRHQEISDRNRTHYCGAYWGYGFHEDGVNSALVVAKHYGKGIEDV